MKKKTSAVADKRAAGKRLDLYLMVMVNDLSRNQAKKLVDSRQVSVNGKIEIMASRELAVGDKVEVWVEDERGQIEAQKPPADPKILFEDKYLLAIDKPPGVVSGPTLDDKRVHAQKLAENMLGRKLILLHRLDKDTSGVLLLAKDHEFAEAVLAAFKAREVSKTYLALSSGNARESFKDSCYLKEVKGGRVQVVNAGGLKAETEFFTLARKNGVSLVRAHPKTGRMHQIRAQLARMKYPILGDSLYGGVLSVTVDRREIPIPRQMLHAYKVSLFHPGQGGTIEITCPMAKDFAKIAKSVFGELPEL